MVITAVLMLTFVWSPGLEGEGQGPAPIMRFVLTFFIIGLASFLTWFTAMIIEIRDRSESNGSN